MGRKEGFVNQMSQNQMDLHRQSSNYLNVGVVLKPSQPSTCPQQENVHLLGLFFNKDPTNMHNAQATIVLPCCILTPLPLLVEDTISQKDNFQTQTLY